MATAVVQHGRRQGTPKGSSAEQHKSGASTLVLKKEDWGRLQATLAQDDAQRLEQTMRQDDRRRLHEASKESVAGWTNTIAGIRQQKLEAKAIREQKEEERRIQLDIEEARFQAEKRREAIQRARALQYGQTDKAKGLQGAVLLSEVLREREAQASIKRERDQALSAYEQELHQYTLKQLEEDARAEKEEQERHKAAAYDHAVALVSQATVKREQRREKRTELVQEQSEIDRRTTEYRQDMETMKATRRQQAQGLRGALGEQQAQKEEIRRMQQRFEEEDEHRRQEYAAAKERLARLKYEREVARIAEGETRRSAAVTTTLAATRAAQEQREHEALEKAIAEQEARLKTMELEKQKKVEMSVKEIKAHHAAERQRLKDQRDREAHLLLQERRENEQADHEFIEAEKQRAARIREQRQHIKEDLTSTMAAKIAAKEEEEEWEVADRLAREAAARDEDEYFRAYAMQQAEAARERGCNNVIPILRVAAPPPPPKEPARTGKQWQRGPGNPAPGNTNLRLGFTWKDQ